jgi:hypothetical protein
MPTTFNLLSLMNSFKSMSADAPTAGSQNANIKPNTKQFNSLFSSGGKAPAAAPSSASAGGGDLSGLAALASLPGLSGPGGSSIFSSLLGGSGGNTGAKAPTAVGAGATSGGPSDILSLINTFGSMSNSGTSPAGFITTITSLLGLLPLTQIIPQTSNQNMAIATSIPQILNLIQSFANFKLPDPTVN